VANKGINKNVQKRATKNDWLAYLNHHIYTNG
jgi:hypothetical protein